MGDLAAIIEADLTTRGLPLDVLLAEVHRDDLAKRRNDYPFIAGYAASALHSIVSTRFGDAPARACAVALMLCEQETLDAISEAATEAVLAR